jgi:HEPN domain-containing protein
MPRKRFAQDDPREWLNRAHSNLLQAQDQRPGVYLEDLCFQAQQATEKAVKAVLLHRRVRFPYIHDLSELVNLLGKSDEVIPPFLQEAVGLTDYAVEARYPGPSEEVTQEEYEETLALADQVVRWAAERIGLTFEQL